MFIFSCVRVYYIYKGMKNIINGHGRKMFVKISVNRYMEEKIKVGYLLVKGDANKESIVKDAIGKFGVGITFATEFLAGKKDIKDLTLAQKYFILNSLYQATNDVSLNYKPFYNSEIKSKFLENYPLNTQLPYSRIFEYSKAFEDKFKKDLAVFTLEQIDEVLDELEPLTKSASHVNGRIITAYIDWSIHNDKELKTNVLKEQPMSYFDKFVDKDLQIYFTDSTFKKIMSDVNNYQDLVIMQLLWEGVQGNALAEIRNLRKDDINYTTGKVKLTDEDGSTRLFTLSQTALKYIERSNDISEYYKKNGLMKDESVGLITNLVDNSYVIRTSITKTDFTDRPVEKMVIYRRIKTLNETLGYPALTTKNIVRSGIIAEGKKLLEEEGKLDNEQYVKIASKFDINNIYQLRKYCNTAMIEKLYKKKYNSDYALV